MKKRRIVVTGMGLISCFGSDVEKFYDDLLAGKSGVKPITEFPVETMPTKFAAWATMPENMEEYVDKKQLRRADPYVSYTMYAGRRALEMAGLEGDALEALDKTRCGVLVGSGMGGMHKYHEGVTTFHERGVKRVSPFFIPYIITNMGSGLLATDVGFMGPNYSISTACATGNHSIIAAANHIRHGDADLMICGGSEATNTPITVAGFIACRALSERNDSPETASRPWDTTRDGFVIGEGCGVLVLEEMEHAIKRGAPILAEYVGGGMSCDAYHMTKIREDGSGIAMCIDNCLKWGDIEKERVSYINCHATSTPLGDMSEVAGIKRAFGDHTQKLKMNGTKSLIGHCLGGAGGVEAIVTIEALRRQKLHPTINLHNPEPDLDIDVCANKAVEHKIDVAISNSFGFGGHNACIAFSQCKDD